MELYEALRVERLKRAAMIASAMIVKGYALHSVPEDAARIERDIEEAVDKLHMERTR